MMKVSHFKSLVSQHRKVSQCTQQQLCPAASQFVLVDGGAFLFCKPFMTMVFFYWFYSLIRI